MDAPKNKPTDLLSAPLQEFLSRCAESELDASNCPATIVPLDPATLQETGTPKCLGQIYAEQLFTRLSDEQRDSPNFYLGMLAVLWMLSRIEHSEMLAQAQAIINFSGADWDVKNHCLEHLHQEAAERRSKLLESLKFMGIKPED